MDSDKHFSKKVLVVYDSFFGNTQKVAQALADSLRPVCNVELFRVQDVQHSDIESIGFLIIGSPTRGGQPSPDIKKFIAGLPKNMLKGKRFAVFDTRASPKDYGFWVRMLMGVIKYAAEKIARDLRSRGGIRLIQSEGFVVQGKEGPLKEGELERAAEWGSEIAKEVT
jgi:flavodoxin